MAFCPDNHEIHIYKKAGSGWEKEEILDEHDHLVTGIDWAPKSNRIVSCSQDRNAYVWTQQGGKWKPTLVILRINRAATSVKWSPDEQKFAVSSGAKCVSVCYFEEDNDWWVSKHIKKHKSTVTSVAWHPNNVLLATGSSDFKARVFSAYIKGIDRGEPNTPFGNKLPFGNCLVEYNATGWVHDVAWSPSGNKLVFVAHDSRIHFVDINSGASERISLETLPFRSVVFSSEDSVIAAGYDCAPILFSNSGGWKFTRSIDESKGSGAAKASGTNAARALFQSKVDYGADTVETTLNTQHQNSITSLQLFASSGGRASKVSTTAVDGKVAIWNC
jgi:actin related protein 2/3 complex subunit 1A/1B